MMTHWLMSTQLSGRDRRVKPHCLGASGAGSCPVGPSLSQAQNSARCVDGIEKQALREQVNEWGSLLGVCFLTFIFISPCVQCLMITWGAGTCAYTA